MELIIDKMNEQYATKIVSWKYEPPYDFYNSSDSPEGIKELMEHPYYAVIGPDGSLTGFFCIGVSAQVPAGEKFGAYSDGFIDLGLGMKPELTGKGFGFAFFLSILDHLQGELPGVPFRLTVAAFNDRAVRLYRKAGFQEAMRFYRGEIEFIVMEKA
ncbi:GNAT family N-acetyltransferase [Neobacillus piezotolerans]|uniref:GNAT family N-acetyltransferase n=1 Tax=Neobacillus piezotolerans TaxID=2259171 RepID=A0A3D8GJX9_9BACI|nr:GNAT family protein [Neobacillus piezotolerans]RDU34760.1 GNAT family N-acetyltransferase [Neobacillus piezotolerans]